MRIIRRWQNYLTMLGVFALALVPRVIRLGTFWGPDEGYHWKLSNNFLMALLRQDWADTVPQGLPGLTLAWIESVGMLLRYAVAFLATGGRASLNQIMAPDQPIDQLAQRELVVVLVNSLIVAGIYVMARRLFGYREALMGGVLVALDPFFIAESRVLRFESLVTGFMVLSVLAALLYVKERRGYILWLSAVTAGLAALTKISAVLLMPVVGLILLILLRDWRRESALRTFLGVGLVFVMWSLLAALTFWAVWPAMWVSPVDTLRTVFNFAYEASEEGLEGRGVFFWGKVYPNDPGPWFYPVNFLFRTTPTVLFGIVLAVFVLVRDREYATQRPSARYWRWWGLAALFVYALFFGLAMTFGAKKYDRYLLPIFPTSAMAAGIAVTRVLDPETQSFRERVRSLRSERWHLGFIVLLAVQAVIALPYVPYYYAYYNPLLGGVQRAKDVVRVGYGEGLDQLATYLNAKPGSEEIRLASAMSSRIGPLYKGETIPMGNLDGRWVLADYVFIYISQLQRDKHDPEILAYLARQAPEYVLRLYGAEYGRLYRGPAAQYYTGSKLEGRGTLYGYDLSASHLKAGETLIVTLFWRNDGQRPSDMFFVRLVDAADYPWVTAYAQPRVGFEQTVEVRHEVVESDATLTLPIGMPPGHYFLKMGFETDHGQTLVGWFELPPDGDDLIVGLPDSYPSPDAVTVPRPLRFATDQVSLFGYDLSPSSVRAGEKGWLTLFWRSHKVEPKDYVVGVRLLAASGREVTYWLGRPLYSGYPTSKWVLGQIVQDPWELSVPPEVAPGDYQLELVLFDGTTGEPLDQTLLTTWSISTP